MSKTEIHEEGFTQAKEEQEKENPQEYEFSSENRAGQSFDPVEPELRDWQKKQQPLQVTSRIRTIVSAARRP
ncbi:MAG: hypothetical protein ACLUTH_00735 [Blautia massiliensis (ex Durand et al. 2017)]